MGHYFFSYGSFDEGYVHYPKISQFIVNKKQAFLKAQVYRLSCGYPAIDLREKQTLVQGSILELNVSENYWNILDALLGIDVIVKDKNIFHRTTEEVFVENYSKVACQVYSLNSNKILLNSRLILGGDWKRDMRLMPPMDSELTDKQRNYLSRLSKTKGRDIVPIQMDLYRELLSMELIVDKGRRVALTKLGKEVSLFLQ